MIDLGYPVSLDSLDCTVEFCSLSLSRSLSVARASCSMQGRASVQPSGEAVSAQRRAA